MSHAEPTGEGRRRHVDGLRANALAAVMMLLAEYALGMLTHLYGRPPGADHGLSIPAAFWAAVVDGPALLASHAVLGTLLVVTAVTALVRAARLRHAAIFGLSIAAFLCITGAWLAGSSLVGDYGTDPLLVMAFADAAAIGCYAVMLFFRTRAGQGATVSPAGD